jgi:hypothetical protein
MAKAKRPQREQVSTRKATITTIMGSPEFARGFADVRAGIPFDWRVGADNGAWNYERGRQLGCIAPLSMPLRIGHQLNPKAVALCAAAFARRLIP